MKVKKTMDLETVRRHAFCTPLTAAASALLAARAARMDLTPSDLLRWLVRDLLGGWRPKSEPGTAPEQPHRVYCRVYLPELEQLEALARAKKTNIGGLVRAAVTDYLDGYQPSALLAEVAT